jgi:hypothetical protein
LDEKGAGKSFGVFSQVIDYLPGRALSLAAALARFFGRPTYPRFARRVSGKEFMAFSSMPP